MSEPLIVSVSGLRGIVGESLTPQVAARYTRAFTSTLPPGPVVVGRDGRESGPMLLAAITGAIRNAGRDVLDCGIAATPTVGIVVRSERAAGGIQISASHNPAAYNGMKLFAAEGRVLPKDAGGRVLAGFEADPHEGSTRSSGGIRHVDGTDEHVRLVLATVDVARIRDHRFRVWIDSCHGAGSLGAKKLLASLGCEVTHVGDVPDGRFEHEPEPTAANLAAWLPQIRASGADVGFFQDPDADRLAIATADGEYVGEEATLALCVAGVLSRRQGPVVVNCSTSGMTAAIARSLDRECHVAAVGEANVVDAMLTHAAAIGGEGNGGVIDPQVVLVRDSLVAMAIVLDAMAATDPATPLATLADRLPRMTMHKTKAAVSADLGGERLAAALDALAAAFPEASPSRLDGLRLDWPDAWALVRASNTEPIVRIVAEARDAAAARELCERVAARCRGFA
jgi:phosphomannomutase